MKKTPRRLAIIISNSFKKHVGQFRAGTEDDVAALQGRLEKQLGFKVLVYIDLTANEMKKMKKFGCSDDPYESDCCFSVIFSHRYDK